MKKRIVSILLCLTMLISQTTAVFAENTEIDATENGSNDCIITIDETSDDNKIKYTVSLPAKIKLELKDDPNNSGKKIFTNKFLMGAKGDVATLMSIWFQPNVKASCEVDEDNDPILNLAKYQLAYTGSEFSGTDRDDIEITVNTKDLKDDGSRGKNFISQLNTDEFKYIQGDIVSESLSMQDLLAGEYKTDITFVFTTNRFGV